MSLRSILFSVLYVLLFALFLLLFQRRRKPISKRGRVLLSWLLASALFYGIYLLAPDTFISFRTAEDAFSYSHQGRIIGTAQEGAYSLLIYQKPDHSFGTALLKKAPSGYRLTNRLASQKTSQTLIPNGFLRVCRLSGTDAAFLWGCVRSEDEAKVEIRGSLDTPMEKTILENQSESAKTTVFYGAVPTLTEDYTLSVNGTTIQAIGK